MVTRYDMQTDTADHGESSAAVQTGDTENSGNPRSSINPNAGGTRRITISGDSTSVEAQEVSQLNMGDVGNGVQGDILSTAKSRSGTPTAELHDKCLVTVEGVEMELGTAASLGYVVKDGVKYRELNDEERAEAEAEDTPEENADESSESLGEELESTIAELNQSLPTAMITPLAMSYINGGEGDINWDSMAEASGVPSEELQGKVSNVIEGLQAQADSIVSGLGVEPQEFYEWAQDNMRSELSSVMMEHAFNRSSAGYKQLVETYLQNNLPTMDALEAAGIPVRLSNGSIVVTIGGKEYDLATAARLGLI